MFTVKLAQRPRPPPRQLMMRTKALSPSRAFVRFSPEKHFGHAADPGNAAFPCIFPFEDDFS